MSSLAELMSPNPIVTSSSASISEAAELMRMHDVGMLPVVDEGRLIGVVTDRDLVVRGLATSTDAIGNVLTRDPIVATVEDDPRDIARKMSDAGIRRLPVCDGERLVGVVSVGDLAVGSEEVLAGHVMKATGPDGAERVPILPGRELTRDHLSNESSVSESVASADVVRDISQSGAAPTPRSY